MVLGSLLDKLKLMAHFGVCFQLAAPEGGTPGFLFPSLAKESVGKCSR